MSAFQSIENQVALVTGGASGIGLAVARQFSTEGVRVALLDTDAEKLEAAGTSLKGDCMMIVADVSSESEVQSAINEIKSVFSQIDIVVNAAGITGITGETIEQIPVDDFTKVFQVNLLGSFNIAKAVLPGMKRRNYGRILLIASIAGKEGNAGMASYSATKAGVIGLTKAIGKEYSESGISINSLAPAVINTPIHYGIPQEQIDYMTDKIPMKRGGELDEIVSAIRFIVSPENSFTTGFCYDLSGGRATY